MSNEKVEKWHRYVKTSDPALLSAMLDDDVVFHSPIVHTPQVGKQLTFAYLTAATNVFADSGFEYVKEIIDGNMAALEFQCVVDGITINAVDIITWNDAGLITEFKVMARPLQGVNKLHERMMKMLEQMKG